MVLSRCDCGLNLMNILFYYQSVSLGGQQTQILNLCREFRQMGHHVSWAYEAGSNLLDEIKQYGTPIHINLPGDNSRRFSSKLLRGARFAARTYARIRRIRKIIASHRIDLIISSDSYSSLLCGIASVGRKVQQFRMIGQDIEVLEHFWYENYGRFFIDHWVDKYFGWPKVYDSLRRKGVRTEKFADYQNHAVNTQNFYPLPQEERYRFRRLLGFPDHHIVLGWVGRLEERMQVKNTLRLAKVLRDRGIENISVLIVGGGIVTADGQEDTSYPETLRMTAREFGIESRTVFTGWISVSDVNRYINAMDIVPLLDEDPVGGSILRETMACGRVALSVDGPSDTQRAFMPDHCTLLVNPLNFLQTSADRVAELTRHPEMIDKIGSRAREHSVRNLSFQRQAESILQNYNC
jgi:glycosyltransferase involved in cell wall biosynthesis